MYINVCVCICVSDQVRTNKCSLDCNTIVNGTMEFRRGCLEWNIR